MQFKINNTEIKISFSFLALILLFLTLDVDKTFILVFIFAIIHEAVHLFFINLLSVAPKKVSFTLFGAEILRNIKTNNNYNSEIIINISAPSFNLIIALTSFILEGSLYLNDKLLIDIRNVNLVLGLFNLIPFYNFDGGNALNNFMLKYLNNKTTDKIMTFISVIITALFSFFSVLIFVKFQHNFSLIFISTYMIFCIIFKK